MTFDPIEACIFLPFIILLMVGVVPLTPVSVGVGFLLTMMKLKMSF